jgi:hypothetical protein
MAKSFSDIMASSGFRTRNVSNPAVLREIPNEGIGSGYSSESSGSDRGPTLRFMDELNQKEVPGALALGASSNDIETRAITKDVPNPYITPSKTVPIPATVRDATSNRPVQPPPPEPPLQE